MTQARNPQSWPIPLFTGLTAAFIYLALTVDFTGPKETFLLLTSTLLISLALEIRRVRRFHPTRWMINPAVFCSLLTFVLTYGATNLLYFLPKNTTALIGIPPEVTPARTKLMLLVIIGASGMWLGYWSPVAATLANKGSLIKFRSKYFGYNVAPRVWALPVLFLTSLVVRLIQVWLSVYGYSSDYDRLIALASYTQYLTLGSSLGKLALIIAAFQFYSTRSRGGMGIWLLGLMAYEVFFGFLSGFKGAVIMPLITVALCQYLRTNRFSRHWIASIPLALAIAYAVIQPFRVARHDDVGFRGSSLTSIATTMMSSVGTITGRTASGNKPSLILEIMGRLNLTYVGSVGISFADENESLPDDSPAFLGNILLSPLHAWIPRLFWKSKPLATLGLWYTRTVMGHEYLSSTGMGPVTYLYFAGGMAAVFLGFAFVGSVQRLLLVITQPSISITGGVLFLNMLTPVTAINSAFHSLFIALFRELPIVLILLGFLYKRTSRISVP